MNVLEKIVADKRIEVETRKKQFSLQEFQAQLSPSDRNFKQALLDDFNNKGSSFILECKKASPSKGLIRSEFDLDEICQAYKEYASCVSVLTDEKYFQGEFERLPLVKDKLHQPVLCKDFFIDEYQVYLARYFGANAILLMLSILNDEEYIQLANVAKSLDLAILTEVSNKQEMERAVDLKADILGINNRNLRDLSTDLNKTPELVSLFHDIASTEQINNTVLISESGIYNHQQVKLLLQNVKGFLVGSSLMAQDDLMTACRDLIVGEHKVCGLKNSNDITSAVSSGAKYQGLILVPSSPRAVTPDQAKTLKASHPTANFVLVVRDLEVKELISLVTEINPAAVQLHGNEDNVYIENLRQHVPTSVSIWKALAVANTLPERWPSADKIVLDTKAADGHSGGTGKQFDWQLLEQLDLSSPPILLAGGVNYENVSPALAQPVTGLDINSGVETSPGVKSSEKIEQIFNKIYNRK